MPQSAGQFQRTAYLLGRQTLHGVQQSKKIGREIPRTVGRSRAFHRGRLLGGPHGTTLLSYRTAPGSFGRHICRSHNGLRRQNLRPTQTKPPARLSPSRNPPMPENRSIYVMALGITLLFMDLVKRCYTINRHHPFHGAVSNDRKTARRGWGEPNPAGCCYSSYA